MVYTRRLIFLYLSLAAILSLVSCSNRQYQVLFQKRAVAAADTSAAKIAENYQYRIQPQDILEIRNLQNSKNIVDLNPTQSMSTAQSNSNTTPETYQVEEDGTVALTGLGHVKVSGLTRYEAQVLIEKMYHQTLLKDPIIALKIVNLKVTLLGEVKSQGNYQLIKDKTTLVDVIGEAGGLTNNANEKDVKIIRGSAKDPKVTEVDLSDINSITDPRTVLQSGDIVYVAQSKRAARNDNLQNFSILLQPALILLNTALIIFTLVRK